VKAGKKSKNGYINTVIGRNRWLKSEEKRNNHAPQRQTGDFGGGRWPKGVEDVTTQEQIGLQRRAQSNYLIKESRKQNRDAYSSFCSYKATLGERCGG
jgi:hypothetical protein